MPVLSPSIVAFTPRPGTWLRAGHRSDADRIAGALTSRREQKAVNSSPRVTYGVSRAPRARLAAAGLSCGRAAGDHPHATARDSPLEKPVQQPGQMTLCWYMAIAAVAAIGVALMTRMLITAARSKGVLDVPNQRSSHTRPTPRGGGAAIVLAVLAAEVALAALGLLDRETATALIVGGGLVAAVGAWDDVRPLTPQPRLLVQFLAAGLAVCAVAGVDGLSVGAPRTTLSLGPATLAVVAIVWMTNLYNFMDGIDGIAGSEALIAGSVACFLFQASGQPGLAAVALVIWAGAAGFLVFNLPPARIFMGDVGSGFLGFTFAVLAISGDRRGGLSAAWVLLPLVPFGVDATATLVRRAARGESVTAAHREHLYQLLAPPGRSHYGSLRIFVGSAILLGGVAVAGHHSRSNALTTLLAAIAATAAGYVLLLRSTLAHASAPR